MRLITAAVLLTFVVTPVRADDPKKVLENLQGEWKLVGLTKNGVQEPKARLTTSRLTITDSNLMLNDGVNKPQGTFTFDSKAIPPTIDIMLKENAGNSQLGKGIYKLERDKLTICFTLNGTNRPKEFKSVKGEAVGMWVLERVKK
jgi:uncharacterized protein (TIGR03067 family)